MEILNGQATIGIFFKQSKDQNLKPQASHKCTLLIIGQYEKQSLVDRR